MKIITVVLFLLVQILSYAQVTYTNFPLDKQLVGRNLSTNKGDLKIQGNVNNSGVNYTSIIVELYRNNLLTNTYSNTLTYSANIASFNFTIPITAELMNYKVRLYGKLGNVTTFEREAVDLVAGDVFVINGQSNAVAAMYVGSANANIDDFIRVYANTTSNISELLANDNWDIGQGDGDGSTNGDIGQWGLKLAKTLIDSLQIPVAIFNGADGGYSIDYFLPPVPPSIGSNYGRLYYRLNKTGLKDKVRAVFWAQGESDGGGDENTSLADYKSMFTTIKSAWFTDYPNIEHIYIFQTRNGCFSPLYKVKEAQRQVAFEDSNVTIMSTQGINNNVPGFRCHFPYVGYETFANRISPLVLRDIYGEICTQEIETPMITDAYMDNNTTLVVETDAIALSIAGNTVDFRLEDASLTDISNTITSISVTGNKITFNLTTGPGSGAKISYLGQDNDPYPVDLTSGFVTNSTGLEIISFYRYVINSGPTLSIKDETENKLTLIYPNPTSDYVAVKLPEGIIDTQIIVSNAIGQEVLNKNYYSNSFDIVLPKTAGIYYVIVKHKNEILWYHKVLKQ